ncbi:hypothetical protein SCE1572_21145 [Sorangium cellulosum So0157-2]|uniref:Uncharacterized protein n=1 Tax=Sorangium cellulosum So0157-2 TaxID=1254432 RepID=S4XU81_SORCE|nr:hypothetical protein SCE1572_21145 [Sorangium cellulosum So0157-2]
MAIARPSGARSPRRRLRPPIARATSPPGRAGHVKGGAAAEPGEGTLDASEHPGALMTRWADHDARDRGPLTVAMAVSQPERENINQLDSQHEDTGETVVLR